MIKYPYVLQLDTTDCAAACLSTICKYYGLNRDISKIRKLTSTDKNGTNGVGLIQGAQKLGFEAIGYEIEHKNIFNEDIVYPCIAHVLMRGCNHYVVIYKVSQEQIIIADPAEGIKSYSVNVFLEYWTGVLFLITPTNTFYKQTSDKNRLNKIFHLFKPHKKLIVSIMISSLIYTGLGLLCAMFFKILFDKLIPKNNINILTLVTLGFILCSIFQMLIHMLRIRLIIKLERKFDTELMLNTYEHIINMPMNFFGSRHTGEIITRLNDASKIRDALSGASVSILVDTVMSIICGIVLFLLNKWLFTVAFCILLLYATVDFIFAKHIKSANKKAMESNAKVNSAFIETIHGIETVKSFGAERIVKAKTQNYFNKFLSETTDCENLHNVLGFITNTIRNIGFMIILWLGAFFVIHNDMSTGELLAFYSLLGYFISPISGLIDLQISLQGATVAFDRLSDLTDSDTEDLITGKTDIKSIGNIKINHLIFKYGTRAPLLKDISLSIKKGERVAIVGESGCGKTTLARLIMGLYDVEEGEILLGGISISNISKQWLRNHVVYVSQEPFFFKGTIRENLLFGNHSNIIDETIMKLANKFEAIDFINNCPGGLDSLLQENASNISGGQRQRLALIRAFLHNPDVLILDEATSHLDVITEKAITSSIENSDKHLTIIVIAHRLSTIRTCDKIIVLADGKIIDAGKHHNLINRCEYYASLWNSTIINENNCISLP